MDAFYPFILSFAAEHWFLLWCALWLPVLAGGLLVGLIKTILVRTYRLIMVLLRGWPPAHVDADGDWRPAPKN